VFRVVACGLLWTGLCLTSLSLTGCSLFKKNAKEPDRAPPPSARAAGGREPARFPGSDPIKDGISGPSAADSATVGGLLAGTVFDAYNNHPKDVFVRYVDLDGGKQEEAPIDVAVSPEGHFTIHGVKPNHHYKLIARAKDGNRMLTGVTYTKAPNIRVHIVIREDSGKGGDIPPLPGAPVYVPKEPAAKKPDAGVGAAEPENKGDDKADDKKTSHLTPGWGPVSPANATSVGGNIPELPTQPIQVSNPPREPSRQPGFVNSDPPAWPPILDTTPRRTPQPIAPAARPSGEAAWGAAPLSAQAAAPAPARAIVTPPTPTRVPSCVLVGKKLVNLALHDLNHNPWEFKTHRKGKLTLIDFWGTMCIPCKQAIPHLRILQSQYGSAGLEVVGIAYEAGSSFEEQTARVTAVAQRLQINYQLLMGAGSQCPVQSSFNIRAIPTLVLIDDNGYIVWRHEGLPNRNQLDELELIIKRRLGV